MSGNSLTEIELTAYHEAGHAVASLTVNLPFEKVSIIPDEKSLGQVIHKSLESFRPSIILDRRSINRAKKHIFTALAGPTAEFKVSGSKEHPGSTQDFKKAYTLAGYLCGSEEQAVAYVDFMWETAKNVVKLNWPSIANLTNQLINFKQMSYRKVRLSIKDEIVPVELL